MFTAIKREPKEFSSALVASEKLEVLRMSKEGFSLLETSDAGFALAFSGNDIAEVVFTSHRIAFAERATISRSNVEVTLLTGVTILSSYMGKAITLTGPRMAVDLISIAVTLPTSRWVTTAFTAIVPIFGGCIPPESEFASFAIESSCIVNAFQTFPGVGVAVSDGVDVDVIVAGTRLT